MRRPDRRSVLAYIAALKRYKGSPPAAIWQRYSLRTKAAAIYRWRNGRDMPLRDLPETPAATRTPDRNPGGL